MANSRSRSPAGPSLSPPLAIASLNANLEHARRIAAARVQQDKFDAWSANVQGNLNLAFGEGSPQSNQFRGIVSDTFPVGMIFSDGYADNTDYDKLRGDAVSRAIPLLETCIENLRIHLPADASATVSRTPALTDTREVFIVHGHDEALKHEVARFVEVCGLRAVILADEANRGRTLIEKFEAHASIAGFAIVLLTPDDQGGAMGAAALQSRARQNVILELGYFIGKLSRSHVCAIYKGALELPSDVSGVAYIRFGDNWKILLAKELKGIWPSLDLNRAFA